MTQNMLFQTAGVPLSPTVPLSLGFPRVQLQVFLQALADNSLTRRRFDADKPSGRGPVVLLRDESSSMGPECDWVRHRSALAFEMSLTEAFNREGRDLVSVAWSSKGTRVHVYGEPGLEEHLSSFLGGGTRIEEPLRRAVEIADDAELRHEVL